MNRAKLEAMIWAAHDVDRGSPRTHDDARDAADDAKEWVAQQGAAIEYLAQLEADRELLRSLATRTPEAIAAVDKRSQELAGHK